MLDRGHPVPIELVERIAALPDPLWARVVRQLSGIVIESERLGSESGHLDARGFGEKPADAARKAQP